MVLDGCGSKYREKNRVTHSHNEVGAKLLGQFAAEFLSRKLALDSSLGTEAFARPVTMIDELYGECLDFLDRLLELLPFACAADRTRFIASRLLCTLVGFVVLPESAFFFWSGDGYKCRDGDVTEINSQNQPRYLAYDLLPAHSKRVRNIGRFQLETIEDWTETSWIAVATDGWNKNLLSDVAAHNSDLALQRWINVLARERGHFEDDGAVALWRRPGLENRRI
jgi:hypothetical protein